MNNYERIFEIKNNIEEEIRKHKLFMMSKKNAINCVFEKVAVFCEITRRGDYEKTQNYLKELSNTNATGIDIILFIQESLKWICRWCSKYCVEQTNANIRICADEIFELMGTAYSYEKFYECWFFHSNHYMKSRFINNILEFEYNDENVVTVHTIYDTITRMKHESEQIRKAFLNNVSNKLDYFHLMYESEFDIGFDFNFGDFYLSEYHKFFQILQKIIIKRMLNNTVVIPGVHGILCYTKKELANIIMSDCSLDISKIERIIDYFTFDYENKKADLSFSYFLPYKDGQLLVLQDIFCSQRPAINALRLLAKQKSKYFDKQQNYFEIIQKKRIIDSINPCFIVSDELEDSQKNRPGMDLLVYDGRRKHLQVIELKYKIPIESVGDKVNLENTLSYAYAQLEEAKTYVNKNMHTILEEYFGSEFFGEVPCTVDHFVITNYSIGMGTGTLLPSPILVEEHYIKMMKCDNGMDKVKKVISDVNKGFGGRCIKRVVRYRLCGYKFKVPEILFEYKQDFV